MHTRTHTFALTYTHTCVQIYIVVNSNFITDHVHGVEDPLYLETVLTAQYFSSARLAVFHTPPNDRE